MPDSRDEWAGKASAAATTLTASKSTRLRAEGRLLVDDGGCGDLAAVDDSVADEGDGAGIGDGAVLRVDEPSQHLEEGSPVVADRLRRQRLGKQWLAPSSIENESTPPTSLH